jgi:hypothetical protein
VREVGAAADVVLAGLLGGWGLATRELDAYVVVATPSAAYLEAGDALVGVLAPAAVRVPGSLVTQAHVVAALRRGDAARIGVGGVHLPAASLAVRRWWDSRVPPLPAARPTPALPFPPSPPSPPLPALPDGVASVADDFAQALAGGGPVERAVARLVGLGPGLTPAGDDVLAGALVALVAGGAVGRAGAVLDAVRAWRHRTTVLSAALLEHAGEGRAVPQLAAFVHAPHDPKVLARLLAVGGTSGAALAVGARAGLSATMMPSRAREVA